MYQARIEYPRIGLCGGILQGNCHYKAIYTEISQIKRHFTELLHPKEFAMAMHCPHYHFDILQVEKL
jgi:hypothetical protein